MANRGVLTPGVQAEFSSNGHLVSEWWWLRDRELRHTAGWIIRDLPSGGEPLVLEITALATDRQGGARGREASFLLLYAPPGSTAFSTLEVRLPNVSPPDDRLGYTCRGRVSIPRSSIGRPSALAFQARRKSPKEAHVAFNAQSIRPVPGLISSPPPAGRPEKPKR
jgi:hypothetical protein